MPLLNTALRRAEAKLAFREYMARCPKHQLLEILGDKWVTLVLKALSAGPRRHAELRREIPAVSQKMLTQTLRALERDGLVTRTLTPSVPVRVDYALTALGQSLEAEARRLRSWAEEHMPLIERARHTFDAGVARARR